MDRNRRRRSRAEHAAAWLVTGPLGHLWSVAADVVVLWPREAASQVRGRLKSSARRRAGR